MKDFCDRALDTAKQQGATYADIRIIGREVQSIMVENGKVQALTHEESFGFRIRSLANRAWGFAGCSNRTSQEIYRSAALAVQLAKAAARVHRTPVDIGPARRVTGTYKTPVRTDPFRVPLNDKITI